jgi:hypothetical protein
MNNLCYGLCSALIRAKDFLKDRGVFGEIAIDRKKTWTKSINQTKTNQ